MRIIFCGLIFACYSFSVQALPGKNYYHPEINGHLTCLTSQPAKDCTLVKIQAKYELKQQVYIPLYPPRVLDVITSPISLDQGDFKVDSFSRIAFSWSPIHVPYYTGTVKLSYSDVLNEPLVWNIFDESIAATSEKLADLALVEINQPRDRNLFVEIDGTMYVAKALGRNQALLEELSISRFRSDLEVRFVSDERYNYWPISSELPRFYRFLPSYLLPNSEAETLVVLAQVSFQRVITQESGQKSCITVSYRTKVDADFDSSEAGIKIDYADPVLYESNRTTSPCLLP